MARFRSSSAPALGALALLLALGPAVAMRSQPSAAASGLECPPFPGTGAFVDRIDNRYMPLFPGTTYVYRGAEDGEEQHDLVAVTNETKTILGVDAVVVHDTVTDKHGHLLEETLDWFAQDDAGNVWYLGEDSKAYDNGQVSTEGSWEAGVDGAQPGIVMAAQPHKGDAYGQECAPPDAEDEARIIDLETPVRTPRGDYGHTLQIRESTPLEPGVAEDKFYAPCIGLVKVVVVKGGKGSTSLVDVKNGPSRTELGCKPKRKHHRKR